MIKQHFEITINASPEKVWNILIGEETYPEWAAVFCEGSTVETDWKKGSRAIFGDGKGSGMVSEIEEVVPNKFLSIKHLGEIKDGVEDTISDQVKSWSGAHENYTLTPVDGGTNWEVTMDTVEDFKDWMLEVWPKALAKVKEMAEAS